MNALTKWVIGREARDERRRALGRKKKTSYCNMFGTKLSCWLSGIDREECKLINFSFKFARQLLCIGHGPKKRYLHTVYTEVFSQKRVTQFRINQLYFTRKLLCHAQIILIFQCKTSQGMKALFDLIASRPRPVAILGGQCTEVSFLDFSK